MNENEKMTASQKSKKEEKDRAEEKEMKPPKARFTSLDFFLIVVVFLCVVGIGFRGTIADFFLKAEPTQKVEISFKTNESDLSLNEVAGIIEGKEFFFDEKNNQSFGVVKNVERINELNGFSATGTIVMDARYTDNGLVSKDNHSVRVGETFNICYGNYTVCVQITEIPRK